MVALCQLWIFIARRVAPGQGGRPTLPRARLLKPGFFKNEELARLTPHHRLLFAGLWTLADREGRLEDRPDRIKVELFPYEVDIDVDRLLTDLQRAGFVIRYAYGDTPRSRSGRTRSHAIAIPTFLEHQAPHHREPASVLPAPVIKRSRRSSATAALPRAGPGPGPGSTGPSLAVPDPVPDPDPVQEPKSSAAPTARAAPPPPDPEANVAVITKLAHEALELAMPSADLGDAVKSRCAQLHIAYNGGVVRKAIESAQAQRRFRLAK